MQFWTFLHILSMFAAVTFIIGAEVWVTYAIRRRDLGALRAYFRVADRADMVGGVLFLAGIVFGLIAAVAIGFDLLQGWLVLAYIVVAIAIAVGFATVPYLNRVKAALAENEGDDVGPELESLLGSPIPIVATAVSSIAVAVIIWDMVFKPSF